VDDVIHLRTNVGSVACGAAKATADSEGWSESNTTRTEWRTSGRSCLKALSRGSEFGAGGTRVNH
jgi:hypothetical protein